MFKKMGITLFLFLISSVALWAQATSDVYYQWGNKLYGQGNYDMSLKYYKAAIQVDPQNWKAYQALGSCEYRLGQTDAAIRDYNQSLAINPNNPSLQAFVGKISAAPTALPVAMPPRPMRRTDALPKAGSITWNIMVAGDIGSYDDFQNFYGTSLNTNGLVPVAVEFGLGADYTIAPSFQVGLNLEGIYRHTDPVSIVYNPNSYDPTIESDQWNETCIGPAMDVKYLIALNRNYNLIFRCELGYYVLVGSTVSGTTYDADGYDIPYFINYDINSSSIGGLIGVEVEWMRGPGWAVDFGLGYRFLNFSTLNYTYSDSLGNSGSGVLPNAASLKTNASMDFSGFNFTTAVRFF